ncbi:MAG: OmpA family protein [Mesorhizobium sp.]
MIRQLIIAALVATVALPGAASAQSREMPSADRILRQLEAQPRQRVAPDRRVTVQEFKRRPDMRRAAPSIEIQSINFAFGSAEIPYSQYGKVEQIGRALSRMIERNPRARFLVEGHTDAVGSAASNQLLSERRAESLKRLLVREFGVPFRSLDTVGYGEEYLLVDTPYEAWENRRVTLRRIDQFIR